MIKIAKEISKLLLCAIPFICVAIWYFFTVLPYGFAPLDQGFILAYSYRIVEFGEIPYRDFYYPRPALSLYLHTVWLFLFDNWAVFVSRTCSYLQLGVASLCVTLASLYALQRRPTVLLLSSCAAYYTVALHNFPQMPWHTIDGVMFSQLALASFLVSLRSKRSNTWLVLASVLFCAAFLSKQNFVFPCIAFGAGAIAIAGGKGRLSWQAGMFSLIAAAIPAVLLLCSLLAGLWFLEALPFAQQQIIGRSDSSALAKSGLYPYLLGENSQQTFVYCGFGFLLYFINAITAAKLKRPLGFLIEVLQSISVFTAAALVLYHASFAGIFEGGISSALFCLGYLVALSLRAGFGRLPEWSVQLVCGWGLLLIAWSSGVSWGWKTPILGLAPLGAFFVLSLEVRQWKRSSAFVGLILSFCISLHMWQFARENPYRDLSIPQQSKHLGEVFDRLQGVYTNPYTADRLSELAVLVKKYASNKERQFTVVRDFPLIHYLSKQAPPTILDWFYDDEIRGIEKRLVEQFQESKLIVFYQKSFSAKPTYPNPQDCRTLDPSALKHGILGMLLYNRHQVVGEGKHFCVLDLAKSAEAKNSCENCKLYERPLVDSRRLDWCMLGGCGAVVADAFCKTRGSRKAFDWKIAENIGLDTPTKSINTEAICDKAHCDGFEFIQCKKKRLKARSFKSQG